MTDSAAIVGRCLGGKSGITRRTFGVCLRCRNYYRDNALDMQPRTHFVANGRVTCPNFIDCSVSADKGSPGAGANPALPPGAVRPGALLPPLVMEDDGKGCTQAGDIDPAQCLDCLRPGRTGEQITPATHVTFATGRMDMVCADRIHAGAVRPNSGETSD